MPFSFQCAVFCQWGSPCGYIDCNLAQHPQRSSHWRLMLQHWENLIFSLPWEWFCYWWGALVEYRVSTSEAESLCPGYRPSKSRWVKDRDSQGTSEGKPSPLWPSTLRKEWIFAWRFPPWPWANCDGIFSILSSNDKSSNSLSFPRILRLSWRLLTPLPPNDAASEDWLCRLWQRESERERERERER